MLTNITAPGPSTSVPADIFERGTNDGAAPIGGRVMLKLVLGARIWRIYQGTMSEVALLVSFWSVDLRLDHLSDEFCFSVFWI